MIEPCNDFILTFIDYFFTEEAHPDYHPPRGRTRHLLPTSGGSGSFMGRNDAHHACGGSANQRGWIQGDVHEPSQ